MEATKKWTQYVNSLGCRYYDPALHTLRLRLLFIWNEGLWSTQQPFLEIWDFGDWSHYDSLIARAPTASAKWVPGLTTAPAKWVTHWQGSWYPSGCSWYPCRFSAWYPGAGGPHMPRPDPAYAHGTCACGPHGPRREARRAARHKPGEIHMSTPPARVH